MRISTLMVTAVAATALAGSALAQPPGGFGGGRGQTPEQREAAFTAADTNKDGSLSKEELTASLPEQAASFADQLFAARDTDGNGSISKEEYMTPPAGRGGRGG